MREINYESVIIRSLRERVRNGSIHLLRRYIELVREMRGVALMAVGVSALVAIFVTGVTMTIAGLIGLTSIDKMEMMKLLVWVGLGLSCASVIAVGLFFRERNWLRATKVYELMDLALHNEFVEPVPEKRT